MPMETTTARSLTPGQRKLLNEIATGTYVRNARRAATVRQLEQKGLIESIGGAWFATPAGLAAPLTPPAAAPGAPRGRGGRHLVPPRGGPGRRWAAGGGGRGGGGGGGGGSPPPPPLQTQEDDMERGYRVRQTVVPAGHPLAATSRVVARSRLILWNKI